MLIIVVPPSKSDGGLEPVLDLPAIPAPRALSLAV